VSDQGTQETVVRRALGLVWRSLAVGFGYSVAVAIGGIIAGALPLPAPSLVAGVDPTLMMVVTFFSGVLFALALGPLSARIGAPFWQRAVLLFVLLFVLNSLINIIEALFFTTTPAAEQVTALVTSGVGYAGLALPLAVLFGPPSPRRGLLTALGETLNQRRWTSWTWRFFLAGLLYVPVYLLFGMIISPIVLPYYQQLGMGLVVPGFEVMLPLEVFRGLLYALTLFPLIAALGSSRRSTAFWIVLTLCVLGSWQPMMQVVWWPLTLRLTHGLEITADSIVQGLIVAWLLWAPTQGRQAQP
jgi:hypothetical protein